MLKEFLHATKLPRTTLGTGLARTGTNTGTPVLKRILAEKNFTTKLTKQSASLSLLCEA